MGFGAITGYVDVAQLVLYAFWAFFFGLIYYLVRENHREGYPMDSGRNDSSLITGWPVPPQKIYRLNNGHEVIVPRPATPRPDLKAVRTWVGTGAPLTPTGNPMLDGVGPGAWCHREDEPDCTMDGAPVIEPLRATPEYSVSPKNIDPRGLTVYGADGEPGGTVTDVWLDRIEMIVRYFEVAVPVPGGVHNVLLPVQYTRVRRGRNPRITVEAILGSQFAQAPALKHPDYVTKLEEEKLMAYFGAGTLYATPERTETWL
jgi:photosynthetic reaction center H subunit